MTTAIKPTILNVNFVLAALFANAGIPTPVADAYEAEQLEAQYLDDECTISNTTP